MGNWRHTHLVYLVKLGPFSLVRALQHREEREQGVASAAPMRKVAVHSGWAAMGAILATNSIFIGATTKSARLELAASLSCLALH